MKVSIIGAGNVGATTALFLAQKEIADLVLVDVIEGMPQGKALDMLEASPVLGYSCDIVGTNSYEDIKDSSIVIITAGLARRPGMDRLDLLKKNAGIIQSAVENICQYAPDSIILIVTNPLDVMTYHAFKVSGFNRERVLGQAGVLDSSRFASFVAKELNVSMQDIHAMVLGGHGDTMLPLPDYTTVSGVPVAQLLSKDKLDAIIDRTRKAGGEIVSLLKTGSAYYSPAASAAYMAEAIIKDKKSLISASVYLEGEYGLSGICIGVPVILGKGGAEKIVEVELTEDQRQSLHNSAEVYKKSIQFLK